MLNGPDDAVRLWWRLTAREETAGGQDPFLIKGRVAAARCAACDHDRHHEVPAKRGHGWVDRCLRCGAVWDSGIEYVVRGTVQASRRPNGLERRLVGLGDLEHCIDRVPRRDALLYGLYLVTDRSYDFVAAKANELAAAEPDKWTTPARGFTEEGVRWAVKRARRVLRSALEARSLLSRQIPVFMRDGSREVLEAVEPLPIDAVVPADPVTWDGLLHEIQIEPGVLSAFGTRMLTTRLARGSDFDHGTVYREVSLWTSVS